MAAGEKARKDVWDKLDVIGKWVSGVLLALIAIVVKIGADHIATSLQVGDLVQSLIGDLTTRSEQVRQDLALIALNHSVGDQNSALVADIAERLFWDLRESSLGSITDEQNSLGSVAFRILEQRDSLRAAAIRDSLLSIVSASAARGQLRSDAGPGVAEQKQASPKALLLARAFPNLVYIQFHEESNRDLAEALRHTLQQAGFYAPGVELVQGDFSNAVRYFHPEDGPLADRVLGIVEGFFESRGVPARFRRQDLSDRNYRVQLGHVEVWMNLAGP